MSEPVDDRVIALMAELKSDRPWARSRAAQMLGRLREGAAPAVDSLAERLLDDDDEDVRQDVARALGDIGPAARDALEALRQAAEDDYCGVRHAAAVALRLIEGT